MIFSAFEWLVAIRYLRSRRKEGFVSVIAGFSLTGIALGVATLIIVMSVMNGFRAELLGRILGLNGHINVSSAFDKGVANYISFGDKISELGGVVKVTPLVEGQAMASVRGEARGAVVRGIEPRDLMQHNILAENIKKGSLTMFRGGRDALVGARFASLYGLEPGDQFSLVAPGGRSTVFGTVPRTKRFRVRAIFEIGMYEYDSSFIYIPLRTSRELFNYKPGEISSLEVMLNEPERISVLQKEIQSLTKTPLRILDWQVANASFFNALKVERNVMFLILTLIILVASFNIISGLIMLVKDKGRDIAILRTMGVSRGSIGRIFLLSGMSVGVLGTLSGLVLGLAFSLNIETIRKWIEGLSGTELFSAEIYFLSKLPAEVNPTEVVLVATVTLGISFIASFYPAWRAARLSPVEALRYE